MLAAIQLKVLGAHLGLVECGIETFDQWQQPWYDLLVALIVGKTRIVD